MSTVVRNNGADMYYVKRFWSYLVGLFEHKPAPVEDPPVKPPVKPQRKKRTPFFTASDGQTLSFSESFSELLNNLKIMFKVIELPTQISWVSADERVGFSRLGIYIPHPWLFPLIPEDEDVIIETRSALPAMMAVAFPHEDTKEKIAPQIFYCLRVPRLPLGVEPLPGHAYKFGEVVKLNGRLIWVVMFVVIDEHTGKVSICREMRQEIVSVRDRHGTQYNKRWNGRPAMLGVHEMENKDMQAVQHYYKTVFKNVFDWWTQRKDESWNVSVKKGKRRLVFSLNRMDTKKYFADRDISVTTTTGKRKKIIHFVNEHERTVKDKKVVIKEHLRGLNKFTWNGYDCVVTAPKFSTLNTVVFDLMPEEQDEWKVGMVGMTKLAGILSSHEDLDRQNLQRRN